MDQDNNLGFILGQTSSLGLSFSLDPSFSIPPTSAFTSPSLESIMSAPMESSMPTIQNSFSFPPIEPTPQFFMGNQQTISPQIAFTPPTASLSSLLRRNDMTTVSDQLGSRLISPFPKTNQIPIAANSSNTPLPLFQSPRHLIQDNRYLYNLRSEVRPQPWLQPLTNLFSLGNQASYNIGYRSSNPYLINPNPNHLYSMGNTGLDVTWNCPALFHQDANRVFRCNACRVEFPTAQAYGGHMSSHSKARKAQEKLEATMREAKKARLTVESTPMLDLSKIASILTMAKENKVVEEVSREGNVARKGKNIAIEPVKEAKEIQTEILGYVSDESVSSEFHFQQK